MQEVIFEGFADWRKHARRLLAGSVSPASVLWRESTDAQGTIFGRNEIQEIDSSANGPRVPKCFVDLAGSAAMHRDEDRWALLYRLLYRLTHDEPKLLEIACDEDVVRLEGMAKAVSRDMHKMRAFVRFRKVGDDYVAWHRPDHHILKANAPFFVRRFGAMRWALLTPERSAYWDTELLTFGPGVPRGEAPGGDGLEELWLTYYASVFNPARVKVGMMKREMPVRHWATMPETALIPELLSKAETRVIEMAKKQPGSAAAFIPATHDLTVLAEASQGCRGCDLYQHATQTVFGEGAKNARVMLVGEQPGDSEDRSGHPFIGPAGRILDQALEEAGVNRSELYVTNAVKHFKFVITRGKTRLHQKPGGIEISACRPWLEAEVEAVHPELIVCLGGTAAQSVMGRAVKVLTERGKFFPHHWATQALITIHPSAILRAPDEEMRAAQFRSFVEDLKMIPVALGQARTGTAN